MKYKWRQGLLLTAFLAGGQARAQNSFTGSATVTATIQTVVGLSLTNNQSTSITLSSPSEYANGYTIANFNTMVVKSNIAWQVSVASSTPYFSNSGVYSSSDMPASIIQLNVNGNATKIPLSTTAQSLTTGSRGNGSQTGNTFNMDLSVNPGYSYGPGIYNISLVYTLSAS